MSVMPLLSRGLVRELRRAASVGAPRRGAGATPASSRRRPAADVGQTARRRRRTAGRPSRARWRTGPPARPPPRCGDCGGAAGPEEAPADAADDHDLVARAERRRGAGGSDQATGTDSPGRSSARIGHLERQRRPIPTAARAARVSGQRARTTTSDRVIGMQRGPSRHRYGLERDTAGSSAVGRSAGEGGPPSLRGRCDSRAGVSPRARERGPTTSAKSGSTRGQRGRRARGPGGRRRPARRGRPARTPGAGGARAGAWAASSPARAGGWRRARSPRSASDAGHHDATLDHELGARRGRRAAPPRARRPWRRWPRAR